MKHRFVLAAFLCFFVFSADAHAAMAGVNGAVSVLCDVMSLLRGRIGRAITMFAILGVCVAFVLGNVSWQKLMMISVGMGIFFAAESIAFVILPATVTGVSGTLANGTVFNPNKKYTPQFILQNVCPEISMLGGAIKPKFTGGSQKLPGVRQANQRLANN